MSEYTQAADQMLDNAQHWADEAKLKSGALEAQEQALVFARIAQTYAISALVNAVLAVADRGAPGEEPS
jgi:hypothetical protein